MSSPDDDDDDEEAEEVDELALSEMVATIGTSDEIAVIDTSSIIEVRRLMSTAKSSERRRVFDELGVLVERQLLTFPRQVYLELDAHHDAIEGEDLAYDWARAHYAQSAPSAGLLTAVKEVLARARKLVDANKTGGVDEADPYIVALSLRLREQGRIVTVVTEDRRPNHLKMSLGDVAGLFRFPVLSMMMYLDSNKIWPK